MKKFLILLTSVFLLSAWEFGGTAFPLLRVGFGARASSLGESFTAQIDDGNALEWNPGSMGFLDHSELFFSYHLWFAGFRDYYTGFVWSTRKGIFGGSLIYSGVNGIELWDKENYPLKGDNSASSWIFHLAYGKKIHPNFSIGAGFKFLYDNLIDQIGSGFAFDLGSNYKLRENLNIGAVIRNFGTKMKYGKSSYDLPSEFRIGTIYSPFTFNTFYLDIVMVQKTGTFLHCGYEEWFKNILGLRLGYKLAGQLNEWTFGFGIRWKKLNIDYAFAPYGILGNTHRFYLSKAWGYLIPVGSIIVKVIDSLTKKPLKALVSISPMKKKLWTDEITGSVKFKDIKPGVIWIKVSKEKYLPKIDSAYILADRVIGKIIKLAPIPPGIIKGKVVDVKTGKPVPADIFYKGVYEGEAKVDTLTGYYSLLKLEPGKYILNVKPLYPEYVPRSDTVEVKSGEVKVVNFELIRRGEVIILKGVNFATGKADILPESKPILDRVGKILLDNPTLKVEIAGHTDNVPIHTPEFPDNMALSIARAKAVKEYLVKKFGINPERLIAKGYGATQPIAPNNTPEGRSKNRRVEFKVLED